MDSWLNKRYGIKPFFKNDLMLEKHSFLCFLTLCLNCWKVLNSTLSFGSVINIYGKTFYTIMVLFSTSIPYNSSNAPLMLSERNTKTVVLPKFQTSRKFFWALNHLLFYLCLLAKTDRLKVKTVGFYPSISLLWQREE